MGKKPFPNGGEKVTEGTCRNRQGTEAGKGTTEGEPSGTVAGNLAKDDKEQV